MKNAMITSADILEATGLQSTKTITRWHQRGLIPKPLIQTHPSGRGKAAYWPESVLERCKRIVQLQRQGHSLEGVARVFSEERLNDRLKTIEGPSITEMLDDRTFELAPGKTVSLLQAFEQVLVTALVKRLGGAANQAGLLNEVRRSAAVLLTLNHARAGYNPVLVYDGEVIEVVADFLVGQLMSEVERPGQSFVVAPALPFLRQTFPSLEGLFGDVPLAWPAPKVWVRDGDAVTEYVYWRGGPRGFELLRETATVVSAMSNREGEVTDDINV